MIFETFFGDDYTLKKLTTEHYIRDARFEALGLGVRWEDGLGEWWPAETIQYKLNMLDWNNTAVLMHHAHFDGLILSHHYGIKPRFIYDTLSMARLMLGNHVSVGLGSLATHYGLVAKNVPYDRFRGKRWADIDAGLRADLAAGCLHDVALTWDIFQRLAVGFPAEEYQVIDSTVRMFTEPQLEGDIDVFGRVWTFERDRKGALLAELGVDEGDLQSAERFAVLLRAEGVEPETKPGKNGPIYAFAKTDDFIQALLENDNERIRTLAEARLGLKSTLDQTRAERLGFMATRGPMPVYLSYCGAHTTRWSGGDKLNFQNFKRGSDLRKGLRAPPGYRIVKADKSQIECRILNYVAGEWDVIERFKTGADPYLPVASQFYGRAITKADAAERGVGKQLELSCLGPNTLVLTDGGAKPITTVLKTDRVWDGVEWVEHQGLVQQGLKSVIQVVNLWLTPDHRVLCGNSWLEALSLQNESMRLRALETGSANLPYLDSLAICSLLPTNRILKTEELLPSSKKKMMTYDLRCAGPRNRYTVLSSAGPLIVHNCGYGAGADTIVRTAKRGTYGPPVQLTPAEGLAARDLYRSTHPNVVDYWRQASRMISAIGATNAPIEWGPLVVETGKVSLQGIPIWYPELHFHRDEDTGEEFWRYKTRKGWAKLYGGKLVENVVQFMSRVDMSQSLLRILARTGIRPAQLEHDAAVWCVPEKLVDAFVTVVNVEMTRAPTWLPDIPLAVEVSVSATM